MMRNHSVILKCQHISKSFSGKKVLDDVSLLIRSGELVCVRGPSGCGKTTLLNIIGLIDRADSGSIALFGKVAPTGGSRAAQRIIRNELNFLLQNFALIESQTVEKNLLFSLRYLRASKDKKHELIEASLKQVGLGGRQHERVAHLSGGEQQRVALARCMIKPGRLIIADEPTGSLDPANRDIVVRLLRELVARGKTVVLATHDEHVAAACDRVIEL